MQKRLRSRSEALFDAIYKKGPGLSGRPGPLAHFVQYVASAAMPHSASMHTWGREDRAAMVDCSAS